MQRHGWLKMFDEGAEQASGGNIHHILRCHQRQLHVKKRHKNGRETGCTIALAGIFVDDVENGLLGGVAQAAASFAYDLVQCPKHSVFHAGVRRFGSSHKLYTAKSVRVLVPKEREHFSEY
jgi:hypothetical protein